ncbi:MAG: FmdB family zinc ribbon protein [Candidatus Omnitrophota bacterium]
MPTYEYECTHCGHSFEAFQKMTDKPLNKCPKCNNKVKRLIGRGAGIIFKGTGFYATDYKKKSKSDTVRNECKACPQAKEGCQTKS